MVDLGVAAKDEVKPEDSQNDALIQQVRRLEDELEWIKSEYALTIDSLFDTLFEISYQVKNASLKAIYQKRVESLQERMIKDMRRKRKPTS